jgi:hypothetical protein
MDPQQKFTFIDSGSQRTEDSSAPGANRDATLVAAPIDRGLEISLTELEDALKNNDVKERWAALRELKSLAQEPTTARAIAERIVSLPSGDLRDWLYSALPQNPSQEIANLLELDSTIRRLSSIGVGFYSDYDTESELVRALADGRDHSVLAPRLAALVLGRESVAQCAALALQGTKDETALRALRSALSHGLEQGDPHGLDYVPLALKGLPDTETQQLIIRAFEHSTAAGWSTVRCSAANALGSISSPKVHSLLENSVMQPFEDFELRIAVAEAINAHGSTELSSRLLPLIDAGPGKTAWILSGQYSYGFFSRIARWAYLSGSRITGDIRVQVAFALRVSQPELAHSVFEETLKNDASSLWPCSLQAGVFVRERFPAVFERRHTRLASTQPASEKV